MRLQEKRRMDVPARKVPSDVTIAGSRRCAIPRSVERGLGSSGVDALNIFDPPWVVMILILLIGAGCVESRGSVPWCKRRWYEMKKARRENTDETRRSKG
ncbi:hypothetical protein M7I_3469 [Glarea lozoyensis 74030]|uniref:Uncharacterized protein n=1 Tax=Glarea lozoyensis (strain ATCC 74030 / MF5533) TaxID=1104152 RepID=H0ELK5_GLAL7|nr:hypothetical protein M7I_3469 [Glarea lozoyensis 74030]